MREDFPGAEFRNLDDLDLQFRQWLDQIANRRLHGTTGRVVIERFAEERPALRPLPAGPFNAVLALEHRISREGMISDGGNLYSMPDGTRRRPVEVQLTASEVDILEDGRLIAPQQHHAASGGRRSCAASRRRGDPAVAGHLRGAPAMSGGATSAS